MASVVKKLTLLVVALALVSAMALAVHHGRATAFSPPNHRCPAVPSLNGLKHGYPILIQTRAVSCAAALTVVRAKESNVGVTFMGNPNGPAAQYRWRLEGLPGWTCFGDGSGFPGHGEGGACTRGADTVEWYHG